MVCFALINQGPGKLLVLIPDETTEEGQKVP